MADKPATAGLGEREPEYLCVCISNLVEPAPKNARPQEVVHAEHVKFLQDLFDRGILFGSGPKVEKTGERHGGAVYILQNVSLAEAQGDRRAGAQRARRPARRDRASVAPHVVRRLSRPLLLPPKNHWQIP